MFQPVLKLMLVGSVLFIFACFLRQRSHFLLALLALELAVVFIVGDLVTLSVWGGSPCEFLMFVMVVGGACEASVGLGLLVYMVRVYGNDSVKSLSIQKP